MSERDHCARGNLVKDSERTVAQQQTAAFDSALDALDQLHASILQHRDLARDLARALAHDLSDDLARALAHDLSDDLARNLARNLAADRDRDVALARALDRARARAFALALERARGLTKARAFAGDLARNLAFALDGDLALDCDPANVRSCALELALALDGAVAATSGWITELRRRRALVLGEAFPHPVAVPTSRRAPGRSCCGVVGWAVRLLPAAHRSRYDAEWRNELWELPRRQRLLYALRLVLQTREMRRALAFVPADGLEQQAPWGRA